MAKTLTRSPKFEWQNYDIQILKKEYFEIGLSLFCKKYKVGKWSVFNKLGYIPDDIKRAIMARKYAGIPRNRLKSKIDRFENTTKVARMYEKKMQELQIPEYNWPWSKYMKF